MPRGPARPFPSISLKEAVVIPDGLREHNAGRQMNRILLADALKMSAGSSTYRDLITAANKFGLVTGNYNSESISLTALGDRVTAPASEEDRLNGLRQAMERVGLFKKLLDHFNNNRLPSKEVLKGVLERPPFSVPGVWSAEAAEVFEATGRFTGVIRNVAGRPYVIREAGPPVPEDEPNALEEQLADEGESPVADATLRAAGTPDDMTTAPIEQPSPVVPTQPTQAHAPTQSNRQFFIAHGKDEEALAQMQSILKELDIAYVVAEEEANAGRPISQKVADLMRACSAGIFIFSGDEEVKDPDGKAVRRPRPNVVFELGAASFQYGQRIVLFKEQGVDLPSDFRDLAYIEYEKGQLKAKSMELLRELIKLKAVRVMPGG